MERHEVYATTAEDRPDVANYGDAVAAMFDQARAWHDAHNLAPMDLARFVRVAADGKPAAVGVSWTVTVGRGDISTDQRLPGVMDAWRWSARFHHWRRVFNRLDGRQGRLLAARDDARGATVHKLFPEHDRAADTVVPWAQLPPELNVTPFDPPPATQ
ncbi:hypothetical protein SEA_VINCENZO_71 [Mycobacterium phage Vincenzo]|uniref:Uncharacterized protein n=1 Tax=Mycobacterium phage Vincenzo TaxID=1647301 RepID=A0A0F6YQG4_9CAUD|nr:hypothetical protein SEA_VINCENZO_71 [Mycobacterium phage Vincenzo]AKF14333.1 hypothetical protein SEA_VINCENZO_71 [Mycobacterium phage Vincenzo]